MEILAKKINKIKYYFIKLNKGYINLIVWNGMNM